MSTNYIRSNINDAMGQIHLFMVNTWIDMNGNEKEAFLQMLNSTVEEFKEEFDTRFSGTCKIDREMRCIGCGDCEVY